MIVLAALTLVLIVDDVSVDEPCSVGQQQHIHDNEQPEALVSELLHCHQLVQSNDQIYYVKCEGDLQPRFEVSTVRLCMIDRQREEHDEYANSTPHDLEEPDAFSLHLLLASLHAHVLQPSHV